MQPHELVRCLAAPFRHSSFVIRHSSLVLEMAAKGVLDKLLGESAWAAQMRRRIPQIVRDRYHVAITGDEGTGKRFLAGLIHELSPRAGQPMIPVDCSMLGESTFASQLFGHVAGALPGTSGPGLGAFRAAQGGTLYLAQVATLPLGQQVQLVDALRMRKVAPLGAAQMVAIDVRVITASTHDLQKQVQERRLLSELYTLLDAVSVHVARCWRSAART